MGGKAVRGTPSELMTPGSGDTLDSDWGTVHGAGDQTRVGPMENKCLHSHAIYLAPYLGVLEI